MKFLVINGPNLNMLGKREPQIYGNQTQDDLFSAIKNHANKLSVDIDFFQSNYEGAIVDKIQQADSVFDGIVINPAAYTHYSYAILDALKAVGVPAVEVHLSDIKTREKFRQHSVTTSACIHQITGKGFTGYLDALDHLVKYISHKDS